MELRKPLALLILWTYGRLCLCAIAIYIAFKLLSTWNHREKTTRNNKFCLKWQTNSQLTFFIAITLTLIETNIETPNILSSEHALTYNVKATLCVSWISAVFLQSVFMKVFFQTVSLRFQNKGLTQAVQLLTSQTWLIKTFLKCKKTSEKHNSIGIA